MTYRIAYMISDHRPPFLVRANDVRFGLVYLPPALDARCPSCGDVWHGVCPACVEWGTDPDVDSPAPDPWEPGEG